MLYHQLGCRCSKLNHIASTQNNMIDYFLLPPPIFFSPFFNFCCKAEKAPLGLAKELPDADGNLICLPSFNCTCICFCFPTTLVPFPRGREVPVANATEAPNAEYDEDEVCDIFLTAP
mmetsp:Transcript_7548/g.15126  ORF Transcript_7548/g.15126 Transcript_7548/m.15126 type:complete len:118 (-) Transcript_7548:277-630(-)